MANREIIPLGPEYEVLGEAYHYGSLCADLRFVEQNMEELRIHYQSGLNEWSYSISVFILRIQQIMYDKTMLKLYKVPRPQTLSPGA